MFFFTRGGPEADRAREVAATTRTVIRFMSSFSLIGDPCWPNVHLPGGTVKGPKRPGFEWRSA
jgi:hypothetical protein